MSVERVEVPAEEGLQQNAGQKADNTQTVEETLGRPEWLPENFKSVEEFVESHKELRADHTRKSQELSELKKSADGDKQDGNETTLPSDEGNTEELGDQKANEEKAEAGEQVLPGVTNDFVEEISKHAWEKGELTEEHYTKLQEAGYSKDIVDQYMEGQLKSQSDANTALLNAGGGADNVQSMFDWAEKGLDQATIDNYNSKFAAGGADALMAMEHLKNAFENSGEAPAGRNVSGANAPGQSTATYKSVAEMQSDMSDPRYKNDPAFRHAVQQKLGRSDIL